MDLINNDFTTLLPNRHLTENVSLFLYSLIKTCRPKKIIEIGAGYSSLFISKAIEDIKTEDIHTHLKTNLIEEHAEHTFEYDPEYTIVEAFENVYGRNNREGIITEVLKQEDLWKNINFVKLNFYDFIKSPCQPYDLVWLDFGTGKEYMKAVSYFYESLLPNGIIIIHSTVNNLAGRLFVTEMKLRNCYDSSFEIMTFEEPHKMRQSSFTIIKKHGEYKTHSVFA